MSHMYARSIRCVGLLYICRINRGVCKLIRTLILIIKKTTKNHFPFNFLLFLLPSIPKPPSSSLSWFLSPPWHISSLFLYIYDYFFVIYQVNFFKREDQRATTVLHDGTNEVGRTVIRSQCAVMELTKLGWLSVEKWHWRRIRPFLWKRTCWWFWWCRLVCNIDLQCCLCILVTDQDFIQNKIKWLHVFF